MSWNQIQDYMIKLEFEGEPIKMHFTCPRCGYRQYLKFDPIFLKGDIDISCANEQVCGEGNMNATFLFRMLYGSYKGLLDEPLNETG